MKTDIEYARDAIIGVVHNEEFQWYTSEKEIWILDYVKWSAIFVESNISVPQGYDDRFGIPIVDDSTVDKFLENIAQDKVSATHLQTLLSSVI